MSDSNDPEGATATATGASGSNGSSSTKRRGSGLSGKLLPELQKMAGDLGITGTAKMRKGELIAAIQSAQGGASTQAAPSRGSNGDSSARADMPRQERTDTDAGADRGGDTREGDTREPRGRDQAGQRQGGQGGQTDNNQQGSQSAGQRQQGGGPRAKSRSAANGEAPQLSAGSDVATSEVPRQDRTDVEGRDDRSRDQGGQRPQGQQQGQQGQRARDDDFDRNGNRRRGRFRERNRGRGGASRDRFGSDGEPVINEDDVLLPIAGIVDILDNYAFVRTEGYLPSPNDVYVSLAQVRRHGLRK